jgi:hypothetical protein
LLFACTGMLTLSYWNFPVTLVDYKVIVDRNAPMLQTNRDVKKIRLLSFS